MNLRECLAACLCGGLAVAAMSNYGYNAGETLTIASGETVTVTDDDIASFNTLAKVKFKDASGTLIFDTSTPPAIEITGYGTIRKTSDADWTLPVIVNQFYSFNGDWDFTGGEIKVSGNYPLGNSNAPSNIFIRAGATLTLSENKTWLLGTNRTVHIAGRGKGGIGALRPEVSITCGFKCLVLDDDAYFRFADASAGTGKYMYFYTACDEDGNAIRLNGHELTIGSVSRVNTIYLTKGTVAGPGKVVVTNIADSVGASAYACLTLINDASFSDPTVDVVLDNYAALVLAGHTETNNFAKLVVNGAHCALCHEHASDGKACSNNCERGSWAGEVALKNSDSRLRFGCNSRKNDSYVAYTNVITGPITGPGSLIVGNTDDSALASSVRCGHMIIGCPTNSFGGSFDYDGYYGCTIALLYSNSVPVYANFSANRPITLQASGVEHGWSGDSVARFAKEMAFSRPSGPTAKVFVDGSLMPQRTVTVPSESLSEGITDGLITDVEGTAGTTVELQAPSGGKARPQAVVGSVLKITGGDPLYVTNSASTTGSTGGYAGEIRYDGVKDIRFAGTFPWWMSLGNGAKCVTFTNSNYDVGPVDLQYSSVDQESIHLGRHYKQYSLPSDLRICAGSVVTTRLQIAYSGLSRARVLQTGGDVTILSSTNTAVRARFNIGLEAGGSGYYELSGGSLKVLGSAYLGNRGDGMLWVKGGDCQFLQHPAEPSNEAQVHCTPGTDNAGTNTCFIATGGKTHFASTFLMRANGSTVSQYTIGGDAEVDHDAQIMWGYSSAVNILNLNGGTLSVNSENVFQSRYKVSQYNTSTAPFTPLFYFNANGGCIKSMVSFAKVLGPTATPDTPSSAYEPLTRVTLFEKGLTIDVGQYITAAYREMCAPTGKGVSAIPISRKPGVYATLVRIIGDGQGASAVAQIDPDTGDLTGILVTSPGFGYTWAKAVLVVGTVGTDPDADANVFETVDCTLADNVGGGLTVKGTTGTLRVTTTNTYAGATTIAGGTLALLNDGYLPEDTTLVFAGGKFDAPASRIPKKFAVDLDRVRTGGIVTNDFNTIFPNGSTITLLNADSLTDADNAIRTLLYVKGTVTGQPEVIAPENPEWKLRWSGDRLTLRHSRGFIMTVH